MLGTDNQGARSIVRRIQFHFAELRLSRFILTSGGYQCARPSELRDNGMSRERVTKAIMWAQNATMSQPLDGDEEKLGNDYQGYDIIVSVDGNKSLAGVEAQ